MKRGHLYFTSDLHLGHQLVSDSRGFSSTADHDEWIFDLWRSVVKDEDRVWILGDLTAGGAGVQLAALHRIAELPGRKSMVLGNHDLPHPMHKQAHRWVEKYQEAFEYITPIARMNIGGESILLSHFPYADPEQPDRYFQWRPPNAGSVLLHGHTHSNDALSAALPNQVHVGLDAHRGLVSETKAVRLIRAARAAGQDAPSS